MQPQDDFRFVTKALQYNSLCCENPKHGFADIDVGTEHGTSQLDITPFSSLPESSVQ